MKTNLIMIEAIRNWRLVKNQDSDVEYRLEDLTIGEAREIASFIVQTYRIDCKWADVFHQAEEMIKT